MPLQSLIVRYDQQRKEIYIIAGDTINLIILDDESFTIIHIPGKHSRRRTI